MAKKMNKVQRVMIGAELDILRGFCRFKARSFKTKGNLERVKVWNDLAYAGDVLYKRNMTA